MGQLNGIIPRRDIYIAVAVGTLYTSVDFMTFTMAFTISSQWAKRPTALNYFQIRSYSWIVFADKLMQLTCA